MPSQTGSSNSNDLASKYSHLLQPIRDLTKNWDIDVAAQLEEYLAEVRLRNELNEHQKCKNPFTSRSAQNSQKT